MRSICKIIVHCSATKNLPKYDAESIRRYHVDVLGWKDIGYHFVIKTNGEIENGRPIEQIGSHCKGHNADSIGICLIGGIDVQGNAENNFTEKQFESLKLLVSDLLQKYPNATVHGHNEFANKLCPCFDVKAFFKA